MNLLFKKFKKKSKYEQFKIKVYEALERKLNLPYCFDSTYNPVLEFVFDNDSEIEYRFLYKIGYKFNEKHSKIIVNVSYDKIKDEIRLNLYCTRNTFIRFREIIHKYLKNIKEYFGVSPSCIVEMNDNHTYKMSLEEIYKLDTLINRTIKLVIIEKSWIKSLSVDKIMDILSNMAIYDKYKSTLTYEDKLILSDSAISKNAIKDIEALLDENLPNNKLENSLYELGFELLEIFN